MKWFLIGTISSSNTAFWVVEVFVVTFWFTGLPSVNQNVTTTTSTTQKAVVDEEIVPDKEPLPWEVNTNTVPDNPGKVEEDEQVSSASEAPAEPATPEPVKPEPEAPKTEENDLGAGMTTDKELEDIINSL